MKKVILLLMCACSLLLPFAGGTAEPIREEAVVENDLTQMSSTMVYAYVYNLMTAPNEYIGQRFKIGGVYWNSHFDETDTTYHYVIIADATACCQQGIEFVLADEAAAYPQPGDEVDLSGVLESYQEGDIVYIHIVADQLLIKQTAE